VLGFGIDFAAGGSHAFVGLIEVEATAFVCRCNVFECGGKTNLLLPERHCSSKIPCIEIRRNVGEHALVLRELVGMSFPWPE